MWSICYTETTLSLLQDPLLWDYDKITINRMEFETWLRIWKWFSFIIRSCTRMKKIVLIKSWWEKWWIKCKKIRWISIDFHRNMDCLQPHWGENQEWAPSNFILKIIIVGYLCSINCFTYLISQTDYLILDFCLACDFLHCTI